MPWAVMAPEFAEQIWLELAAGNRHEALILLQSLATYIGRLLPEESPQVIARVD